MNMLTLIEKLTLVDSSFVLLRCLYISDMLMAVYAVHSQLIIFVIYTFQISRFREVQEFVCNIMEFSIMGLELTFS